MEAEKKRKLTRSLKMKIILIILLLISFSLGSIFGYRLRGRIKGLERLAHKTSAFDLRVCLCQPDKDNIKLERDDGLIIIGSLYGLKGAQARPGILLLHGNTPHGRKLALYRILAKKLADRGYLVLTIDQAGFGQSDDAFRLGTLGALDGDKDVRTALDYLKSLNNLDQDQIFIIGHSGGVGPAISVGTESTSVKKIIAIGPPRRVTERFNDPHDRDYFWKRARLTRETIYKKPFPSWYTKDFWLTKVLDSDMKKYVAYFSQPSHKPLFLIDGELESKEDKIYLHNYYMIITQPKKYVTIPNSDHYCNTTAIHGLSIYSKTVVMETVNEIDQWLRQ